MKQGIWAVLLLVTTATNGQQVDVSGGNALEQFPYFSEAFIQQHGIQDIRGTVTFKDEYFPIRETRSRWFFAFDTLGRIRVHERHTDRGSWIDSTSVRLTYGPEGNLVHKRERDLFGIHYYTYTYDSLQRLQREVYARPAIRRVAQKETTYRYPVFADSVYKQEAINNLGIPFSETIYREDRNGRPKESVFRYKLSGLFERTRWVYDRFGRVAQVFVEKRTTESHTLEYRYLYDESGNPLTEEVYEDGQRTYHREFLYREGLLHAYLSREEQTQRITIITFSYTYFSE